MKKNYLIALMVLITWISLIAKVEYRDYGDRAVYGNLNVYNYANYSYYDSSFIQYCAFDSISVGGKRFLKDDLGGSPAGLTGDVQINNNGELGILSELITDNIFNVSGSQIRLGNYSAFDNLFILDTDPSYGQFTVKTKRSSGNRLTTIDCFSGTINLQTSSNITGLVTTFSDFVLDPTVSRAIFRVKNGESAIASQFFIDSTGIHGDAIDTNDFTNDHYITKGYADNRYSSGGGPISGEYWDITQRKVTLDSIFWVDGGADSLITNSKSSIVPGSVNIHYFGNEYLETSTDSVLFYTNIEGIKTKFGLIDKDVLTSSISIDKQSNALLRTLSSDYPNTKIWIENKPGAFSGGGRVVELFFEEKTYK